VKWWGKRFLILIHVPPANGANWPRVANPAVLSEQIVQGGRASLLATMITGSGRQDGLFMA
jgi:hypothetical protein